MYTSYAMFHTIRDIIVIVFQSNSAATSASPRNLVTNTNTNTSANNGNPVNGNHNGNNNTRSLGKNDFFLTFNRIFNFKATYDVLYLIFSTCII